MQQAFAQPARNRALYTGACLLALASFIELCHLGAGSASAGQRVQAIEAASDACLAAAHEAVKQKGLALLPGTQVSVTLVSGPIQQSDGASSCRAFANVRPPNSEVSVKYDLTLTAKSGRYAVTAMGPHYQ